MTKQYLAQAIVDHVDHAKSMRVPVEEIVKGVESFLDLLHPIDKYKFAKWGFPDQQSETEKCWP